MKILCQLLIITFMQCFPGHVLADNGGWDLSFLNEHPYRKGKQRVDLSELNNKEEVAIVRDAINPIMQFFYSLTQKEFRKETLELRTTENGRRVLRYPPMQDEMNRYGFSKIWKWYVIDANTIQLSAELNTVLRDKRSIDENFIFIKVDGQWKFDRHE